MKRFNFSKIAYQDTYELAHMLGDIRESSLSFITAHSNAFALEMAETILEDFERHGVDTLRIDSKPGDQGGFKLFSNIGLGSYNSPLKTSDWESLQVAKAEELAEKWHYLSSSQYQYEMYQSYGSIKEALFRRGTASGGTILVFTGVSFKDVVTGNLIRLLIEELALTESTPPYQLLFITGDSGSYSIDAQEDILRFGKIKGLKTWNGSLPLPSLLLIGRTFDKEGFPQGLTKSLLADLANVVFQDKLTSVSDRYVKVVEHHLRYSSEDVVTTKFAIADALSYWGADLAFQDIARKIDFKESLTDLEKILFVHFSYFYPAGLWKEAQYNFTKDSNWLVRFATLKVLNVYIQNGSLQFLEIESVIEGIIPYAVRETNQALINDVFFTILRSFLWSERKEIIDLLEHFLDQIPKNSKIGIYRLLVHFFVTPDVSDPETLKSYSNYMRQQQNDNYRFVIKENLRFMSLYSVLSYKFFQNGEMLDHDEVFAEVEERIQRVSSDPGNAIIARANLARVYQDASKAWAAKKLFSEITIIRESHQISQCTIPQYAEGSIIKLYNAWGIWSGRSDYEGLGSFELDEPAVHNSAVFVFDQILSGKNIPDFTDLIKKLCEEYSHTYKGRKVAFWMLVPLSIFYLSEHKYSLETRLECYELLRTVISIDSLEEQLSELYLKRNKEAARRNIDHIHKSILQNGKGKASFRLVITALLSRAAARDSIGSENFWTSIACQLVETGFAAWKEPEDRAKLLESWIFNIALEEVQTFANRSNYKLRVQRSLVSISNGFSTVEALGSLLLLGLSLLLPSKNSTVSLFSKHHQSYKKRVDCQFRLRPGAGNTRILSKSEDISVEGNYSLKGVLKIRDQVLRYSNALGTIEIILDMRDSRIPKNTIPEDVMELFWELGFVSHFEKSVAQIFDQEIFRKKSERIVKNFERTLTRHHEAYSVQVKRHKALLHNLGSIAICTIADEQLTLTEHRTLFFEKRFLHESELPFRNYIEAVLNKAVGLSEETRQTIHSTLMVAIGMDNDLFVMNRHSLPNEMRFRYDGGTYIYEVTWDTVVDDKNMVVEISVAHMDVTESRALHVTQVEEMRQSDLIMALQRIDPAHMDGFLRFAWLNIEQIRALSRVGVSENTSEIKSILHRLKGIVRTHGFSILSEEIHKVEDNVDERLADGMQSIANRLQSISDTYHAIFRKYGTDTSEIAQELKELKQLVASSPLANDAAIKASLNSTDKRHFEAFIRGIATGAARSALTRGKASPLISLEGNIGPHLSTDLKDLLMEVLPQMVINSVDHSIEVEEDRLKLKKSPQGHILLTYFSTESTLSISISDDGQGVDTVKLRQKAESAGLIPGNTADDILSIMMSAGISTASRISEVSGKGIGVGAVASTLMKAGGRLTIEPNGPLIDGKMPVRFIVEIPLSFQAKLGAAS